MLPARMVTCCPHVAPGRFFSAGFHNMHVTMFRCGSVPCASVKFLLAGVNSTLIHVVRTLCFVPIGLFSGSMFPGPRFIAVHPVSIYHALLILSGRPWISGGYVFPVY